MISRQSSPTVLLLQTLSDVHLRRLPRYVFGVGMAKHAYAALCSAGWQSPWLSCCNTRQASMQRGHSVCRWRSHMALRSACCTILQFFGIELGALSRYDKKVCVVGTGSSSCCTRTLHAPRSLHTSPCSLALLTAGQVSGEWSPPAGRLAVSAVHLHQQVCAVPQLQLA